MEGSEARAFSRVRASVAAAPAGPAAFVFGPFRLDSRKRVLTANGQEVALQPRAFDMLEMFVACDGQVLSGDEIVVHVWRGIAVGDNNLGVQLSALRRVLAAHGGKGLIVTLPGRGYRFVGDVTEEADAAQAADRLPQPRKTAHPWHSAGIAAMAVAMALVVAVLLWRPLSRTGGQPATASSFSPPLRSIAVLAFANLSGEPGQDYLSEGLSEALIDVLSRVSLLQVTARTSSFTFKGSTASIEEIAHRLNVASVLEGSLRRQGSHLRIDARLNDARTGYQLWSQSYDLEMADMLKLQDEIAGAVAEALQARLLDTNYDGGSLGSTRNPQAFDAYLRGQHHLLQTYDGNVDKSFDENDSAILEFRKAAQLDPDFALALASLSSSLVMKASYTMSTADPAYRKAIEEARMAAEHAVAVAPGLGLPHAELGMILLLGVGDLGAAWAEAVRARALTPGNATVEEHYAQIAVDVGRSDEAMRAASRAVELDPLHPEPWWNKMRVSICARKYDAARDALQRGIAITGHPPSFAPFMSGNIFLRQGKAEAARQVCVTSTAWTAQCLAIAYHMLGRQKDAEANAAKMYADSGDDNSYNLAEVYAQWNQRALAMHWLEKAREISDPALGDMDCDAWLDPIRGEPRFREIEQSLHLPPPE